MATMKRKKIANLILLLVISAMQYLGGWVGGGENGPLKNLKYKLYIFWLEFGQPFLGFQPKMSLKEEKTSATWWKPSSQVRLEGARQFKILKSSPQSPLLTKPIKPEQTFFFLIDKKILLRQVKRQSPSTQEVYKIQMQDKTWTNCELLHQTLITKCPKCHWDSDWISHHRKEPHGYTQLKYKVAAQRTPFLDTAHKKKLFVTFPKDNELNRKRKTKF